MQRGEVVVPLAGAAVGPDGADHSEWSHVEVRDVQNLLKVLRRSFPHGGKLDGNTVT